MRLRSVFSIALAGLVSLLAVEGHAQAPITRVTLGPDQIGTVRLAVGITTRVSFPEPVREIICGDLYDAASGKGTFVIQRSDNDVYLKPVAPKGSSNLFVKTGANGEHVYNFDITVVLTAQANRVIHVSWPESPAAADKRPQPTTAPQPVQSPPPVNTEAILQAAREQAAKIIADAEQNARETERLTAERIEKQVDERFLQALLSGLRETRLNNPRVVNRKFAIALDQRVLVFDERAYLRFTIENTGDEDLSYSAVTLETISDNINKSIPVEVVQTKSENTIRPGETIVCVLIFDPNTVGPKDRLTLNVRGEGNTEIARVRINQ